MRRLAGYRPTPLRDLPAIAAALGLRAVAVKDESDRLGLPAFKVLGASWAVERALREQPDVRMLVAASAGNHGRAVARVAALRGLACRIYLPAGSAPARAEAIAAEGAEVVVTGGAYEQAVLQATRAGEEPGAIEIADVGESGPARWVVDGYQTLYAEIEADGGCDVLLVPVGVGSLAAAAARYGAECWDRGHGRRARHGSLPDGVARGRRADGGGEPRHHHGRASTARRSRRARGRRCVTASAGC